MFHPVFLNPSTPLRYFFLKIYMLNFNRTCCHHTMHSKSCSSLTRACVRASGIFNLKFEMGKVWSEGERKYFRKQRKCKNNTNTFASYEEDASDVCVFPSLALFLTVSQFLPFFRFRFSGKTVFHVKLRQMFIGRVITDRETIAPNTMHLETS